MECVNITLSGNDSSWCSNQLEGAVPNREIWVSDWIFEAIVSLEILEDQAKNEVNERKNQPVSARGISQSLSHEPKHNVLSLLVAR